MKRYSFPILLCISLWPILCFGQVDTFYTQADQKAEFPGGDISLLNYISENIHYPDDAIQKDIEGRVTVQAFIDSTGVVVGARIFKPLFSSLDSEALKVVLNLPKWAPASINGHNVNFQCFIPVNFRLIQPTQLAEDKTIFPEFEGDFFQFAEKNLKYPKDARLKGIEGRVVVKFTIDSTGKVVDPVISRSLYNTCDSEALRIVRLMHWKPGLKGGKPVNVTFLLPIKFELPNNERERVDK